MACRRRRLSARVMRASVTLSFVAVLAGVLLLASCGGSTPTSQPAVQRAPSATDISPGAKSPAVPAAVSPTLVPASTVTSVLSPTVTAEPIRAPDVREPTILSAPTAASTEHPTAEATAIPESTRVEEDVSKPADAPSGSSLSPAELEGLADGDVKSAIRTSRAGLGSTPARYRSFKSRKRHGGTPASAVLSRASSTCRSSLPGLR